MGWGTSLEKVLLGFSFTVFTFVYGFAACAWGLFPQPVLLDAWGQAKRVGIVSWFTSESPHYLHRQVYEREGARIMDPEAMQPGLTFITSVGRTPEIELIDRNGEIVHEWTIDMDEVVSDSATTKDNGTVHGSYLFPNGDVLVNLAYGGTMRVNACGDIRWQAPRGHHSVARAEDGSFWTSAGRSDPQIRSEDYPDGFPGLDRPVHLDVLRHVSADGEILRQINVLDVLYANGLYRYIPRAYFEGEVDRDITHLNDVDPLDAAMADEYPLFEAGDLAVSLRHLNLVFVVDPETKEVRWHASSPFIRQHDPDFIGDGWIGVFDNNTDFTHRGSMLGGSRVVALQPHTDSLKVLFPTARSDTFYTAAAGKWQQLENGNMLLTETFAGRVVEVAPDGRTVWDWVHEPYENSQVPEVTEGTRYDLTRSDVAAWPCSSLDSLSTQQSTL